MKFRLITIEGNIGVGKTTLANILSKKINARLVLEKFAENPFLSKFYENPSQYAFSLEVFFMTERYTQQKELVAQQDLLHTPTITDYLFSKSLLFAKVNLAKDEFELYQRLFDIVHHEVIQPELLIYLHAPVSKLQENIKKRNRSYELHIKDDYLYSVEEAYTNYINKNNLKTLFIDASNADFVNNDKHIEMIINIISQDINASQSFITLP